MSGVIHAVKSIFHGVAHAVGHIVHEIAAHWQEIALVAAVVFTGGVALGVWGGAAAAGAAGGASAFGAVGTAAAGQTVSAGVLAADGSGLSMASGLAAAAPAAELGAAGMVGSGLVAGSSVAAPAASLYAAAATQGATAGSSSFLGSIFSGVKTAASAIGSGLGHVASFIGGGNTALGSQLLMKGAFDAVGAYMTANPPPPRNFGGFGPNGGAGLGMHTINNGFGLATGGSTAAPSGPPSALIPPAGSGNAPGVGLSNAANLTLSNNGQAPANIGQTVANNAGVGGLVPQGAVNFNQPTLQGAGA